MEMLKLDLPLVSSADIPNIENYLGHQAVDNINLFKSTRSCAALRAADLDWIVWPEYSLGGY